MTPVVCPSVWRGVVSSYFPQDSTPTAPGSLLFFFRGGVAHAGRFRGVRQAACLRLKLTGIPLSRYGVRSRGLLLQQGPGKERARTKAQRLMPAAEKERWIRSVRISTAVIGPTAVQALNVLLRTGRSSGSVGINGRMDYHEQASQVSSEDRDLCDGSVL